MAAGQNVFIPNPEVYGPEPKPNNDGTPTQGLARVYEVSPGKVVGSAGDDRVSISDLIRDKDQIIKTGAGDDVFNFNGSESGLSQNLNRVNGIIDFGTGNDRVFLGYQIEDYKYTLRSDGGIKIQYVGDDRSIDGVAVTFRNADSFTFRNFDNETGKNFETVTLSYDELRTLILNPEGV